MPARLISHYRVVRRLGVGGMGEVFLAQDTQLERPVALKLMSAELAKDPNQRKRFRTEAKAASGLTHPHICVIHEVGETEGGRPFLAMEYVEGQTLDVLLQERRLKLRETLSLGIEVAEALEAAHARGLVHRDIKPGNIMLDRRGGAKVLDFGLAKWFAPDELSGATSSVAHTRTGMLIGTPQYMSPEQALGRTLDPRTDLFSLGVVLYELVAGQRPFLGKTVGETINNIVNQPAAPLGLENPVFSPALDDIIFRCLEKDPEKRYDSAQALVADLQTLNEDSEKALAAAAQERPPAPVTPTSSEREPTALWKLATNAGAGHNAALGWTVGIVVVALLALGGWALLRGGGSKPSAPTPTPTSTAPQKSVAVLPFVNMSSDKENEYLSDGLSEDLCTALTQVTELHVPARTSCFAFKGKTEDIRRIGEQLRVATVLEGSVSRAGNKLRINAQLIDVASGFHLWATNYDREMADILEMRSEIARQVVTALKIQLGVGEAERIARKPTDNPAAYALCLQGRYWSDQATSSGFTNAVKLFQQAIALDPGYGLAYAGLAEAFNMASDWLLPPRTAMEAAKTNAETALRLDETLAQAHVVMSYVKDTYDYDHEGGRIECERALALAPNLAEANRAYGGYHLHRKQFDEARQALRRAWQLDPLSAIQSDGPAMVEYYARDYAKALELSRATVSQFPNSIWGHIRLAWVCEQLGRYEEAIAEITRARAMDDTPDLIARQAHIYASAGQPAKALELQRGLEDLRKHAYVSPAFLAWVHLGLNQTNEALARLQEAFEDRDGFLACLAIDPYYDPLRGDPRFIALVRKIGLPP